MVRCHLDTFVEGKYWKGGLPHEISAAAHFLNFWINMIFLIYSLLTPTSPSYNAL